MTHMFKLNPGEFARIEGTTYRFKHTSTDGRMWFEDLETGRQKDFSEAELLRLYSTINVELAIKDPSNDAPWERTIRRIDFSSIPANSKKVAEQRKKILDEILKHGSPFPINKKWPAIIAGVVTRESLVPLSWQQANRLMKKYLASGKDLRSLIPGFTRRGAGLLQQSKQEREFFEAILATHGRQTRPTIKKTYSNVKVAYQKAAKQIVGAANWKVPSYATVRRRLQASDPYEMMKAREGKRAADAKFKYFGRREAPLHVLEVVEIDHTVADLLVVDERWGYILGRPTITVAIDVYSHMIVGVYIGLEPAGTSSVMQCVHNMVMPKTYMATEYPDIAETGLEWPAFGIPINVVVDNGLEFHSESVKAVFDVLGTSIIYAPVYTPQAKPLVERFMETISVSLLDGLRGRTYHNSVERGDYDAEADACITLQEFRHYFHTWLVSEYNSKVLQKFGETPLHRWQKDVERNPVRLPESALDLDLLLGIRRSATLTKEGLVYGGLRYCSPELNAVRRRAEFDQRDSKLVEFIVNETDLGAITVIDPIDLVPFKVPCATPEASVGVSLFQHKAIRKTIREAGEDPNNAAALAKGRKILVERMDEFLSRKGTTNRKRKSRGLGGDLVAQPKSKALTTDPSTPSSDLSIDIANLIEGDDEKPGLRVKNVKPFFVPSAASAARPASMKIGNVKGYARKQIGDAAGTAEGNAK